MKKQWLTLIAGAAVFAVLGAAFGGDVLKTLFPQYYVSRAVSRTVASARPQTNEIGELALEIFEGSWRQEIAAGIDTYRSIWTSDDEELLELLRKFELVNTTGWYRGQNAMFSDTAVLMSGTPIFNIDLFLDRETAAVRFPQAYDNFIFANTNRLASEWTASPFGWGPVDEQTLEFDAEIFEWLMTYIFDPQERENVEAPAMLDIEAAIEEFMQSIWFQFGGREAGTDVYHLSIPGEAVTELLYDVFGQLLTEEIYYSLPREIRWALQDITDISIYGNIELTLHISGDRVVSVEFSLSLYDDFGRYDLEGHVRLEENNWIYDIVVSSPEYEGDYGRISGLFSFVTEGRIDYQLSATVEYWEGGERTDYATFAFRLNWDYLAETGDNFMLNVETYSSNIRWDDGTRNVFSVEGHIRARPEGSINADFRRIRTAAYRDGDIWTEFIFNIRYELRADDTPITFDRSAGTALASLTGEDYEEMEARVEAWVSEIEAMIGD